MTLDEKRAILELVLIKLMTSGDNPHDCNYLKSCLNTGKFDWHPDTVLWWEEYHCPRVVR